MHGQAADRFVLKSALMLLVWRLAATRPTRDLLARMSNDLDAIAKLVIDPHTVCLTEAFDQYPSSSTLS